MEKGRKPGYFARLKRRKQIKQHQSEIPVAEQNQSQVPMAKQNQSEALLPEQNQSQVPLAKQNQSEPSVVDLPRGIQTSEKKSLPAVMGLDSSSVATVTSPAQQKESLDGKQPCGTAGGLSPKGGVKKEKIRPPGTVEYTVGPQDTLNCIALKFNITPNKLVQLNRLFSHSVYPGQTLFVPDVSQSEDSSLPVVTPSSDGPSSKVSKGGTVGTEIKPFHRVLSPGSEDEEPATVKFLKMSCRYFTDGKGVVGGVMIVTPNNIMFDPHKSDPLVIENGCEEYGLICPMAEVVSIALYPDISHMKLKDALPSDLPQDLCPLYRPRAWEDLPSEQDLNPFSRFQAMGGDKRPIILDDIDAVVTEATERTPSDEGFTELENTDESQESCPPEQDSPRELSPSAPVGQEGPGLTGELASTPGIGKEKAMEDDELHDGTPDREITRSAPATVKPKDLNLIGTDSSSNTTAIKKAGEQRKHAGPSGKCSPPEPNPDREMLNGPNPGREMLNGPNPGREMLNGPNPDREMLNGPNSVIEAGNCDGVSPAQLSDEEERKRNSKAEMKLWLLKRMQGPIEDMLLSKEEKSKNPPMFLCFKVGKPMRKSFAIGRNSSPAHDYGKRGQQPEYWFAVPQERVDHLYAFFVQWSPDVYGKDAREQGFVVVEKDELDMIDNFFSNPAPKSWEIITVNEAKRRQSVASFEEEDLLDLQPVLSDSSLLLRDTLVQKLAYHLPARTQGYPWRLAYSTAVHGTSLKTLYRNLAEVDSPVLLVVKDMDNQVFGAFSSHPFRISEHCFGTGETFLYSFCPEMKVFRWTGENSYFVKGNTDSLQMGGGGHFGLWLDADLYHGSSSTCSTFQNQPLSAQQDFTVQGLEVWAFQ